MQAITKLLQISHDIVYIRITSGGCAKVKAEAIRLSKPPESLIEVRQQFTNPWEVREKHHLAEYRQASFINLRRGRPFPYL